MRKTQELQKQRSLVLDTKAFLCFSQASVGGMDEGGQKGQTSSYKIDEDLGHGDHSKCCRLLCRQRVKRKILRVLFTGEKTLLLFLPVSVKDRC